MSTIPITASTESFTPACMAEIEGAPSFTFRHATELDRYEFAIACTAEGLKSHNQEKVRETIVSELRRLFEGEGLERNITRLEAYWQAGDDLAAAQSEHRKQVVAILKGAKDGEKPELPEAPVLDFPKDEIAGIDLMLAQVNEHSEMLSLMAAQNVRYSLLYPRVLLRMLLVSTTLPVQIQRRGDIITPACGEEILATLGKEAKRLGVDPEKAKSELLAQAGMAFVLTEDEEKNSSSPPSDTTSPEQSATTNSHGKAKAGSSQSSAPATSEPASGSSSSD